MKLDFNYILTNKEIISKNDILTINYITATGKGCFKLLMPAKFPTTAATMKIIIDMFLKAEAPEHITPDLIAKMDKLNFKKMNDDFLEVLEGAENVVINDDIYIIYNDETTAPAEEAPRPEAVENETTAPATAEETENKPRPHAEVAPDPDINNAINLCDTNYCYTIIAEPHGCYTVIGQNTAIFKYISIRIDSTGAIQLYSNGKNNYTENKYFHNDNTVLLYDLYEKLFALDLLPHYEPTETTRENIKGIYNRHTTPRPQPPYYIAVIPEAMNHTTTGDSTPASLKRANIPPRPNKRRITSYNRRQQPNKGILYHYNAIQGHYNPAGLYSGIKGYTRAYNAQTAPPGLYATGDSLKAGIIRAQTMPNLSYHDTC